MEILLIIWLGAFGGIMLSEDLIIDFGKKKAGQDWSVINDSVMGGKSEGTFTLKDNCMGFSGFVSMANGGGFSSLKGAFRTINLSGYGTTTIRCRGEGLPIAMTLESSQNFFEPYFKISLPLGPEWKELTLNLTDFKAFQIGAPTDSFLTQSGLEQIRQIGFITDSKKEGEFSFEVDYIIFR